MVITLAKIKTLVNLSEDNPVTTENFAHPRLAPMGTGKGYPTSTNEFIGLGLQL